MENKIHVPNHHFASFWVAHCLGVRRQYFDWSDTTVKVASKPGITAAGQAWKRGLPNPANNDETQQHKQPRLGTSAGSDWKGG